MQDNFYRISIKALVWEDESKQRVLLSLEENGKWELLGGGIHFNETPQEALKREVKEETGLDVIWVADKPELFFTFENELRKYMQALVLYEAKLKDLNFKKSQECVDLKFFTLDEIENLNAYGSVKKFARLLQGSA